MNILRTELRSLTAFLAFEAAARYGNFTNAAEELNVTRVAVSRHIKSLESDVGVLLFKRLHRGVQLTDDGKRLFEAVSKSLHDIALAKNQIRAEKNKHKISVTMTPAFATFWMIPRMKHLHEKYPDLELCMVVSDHYLDLDQNGIDMAIRYGSDTNSTFDSRALVQEKIFPVCSSTYEFRCKNLTTLEQLRNERLLHLSGMYRKEAKWPNWFQSFDLEPPDEKNGLMVDSYSNMIHAALEGEGIALGASPLVDRFISNGSLIRPIVMDPYMRDYYYLVQSGRLGRNHAAECFCDWILSVCDQD